MTIAAHYGMLLKDSFEMNLHISVAVPTAKAGAVIVMSPKRRRARPISAALGCLGLLVGITTTLMAPTGPAQAEVPPPGPKSVTEPAPSPYGNPYTDYLRTPFGVTGSPQQQANLSPIDDDPNEPFDWYRYPTSVIGVFGGPEESVITPEGNLQTVSGTLAFSTGEDRTPIDQRVKTWKDGYLPILQEQFSRDGVRHDIQMFAATVPGVTKVAYRERYGKPVRTLDTQVDNMVNFVKVDLTNTGDAAATYRFSVNLTDNKLRANDGNTGPSRPATATWDSDRNAYIGDGKLLFTAADSPTRVGAEGLDYDVRLAAGQTRSLVFKMPYFVAQESDVGAIRGADYNTYLTETADFWHRTLDQSGTRIDVPGLGIESKILDTYKASLAFSLLLFDKVEGQYFWDANPAVYDGYWLRDTAFDVDGMLNAGFPDIVRGVALGMLDYQQDNGEFNSQTGQIDATGQALWTFGNYYARTQDEQFAQQVWPAVQRAMAWEWQVRDGGLMPEAAMEYDNEGVRGHLLTYDLWNIAGEQGAAEIARAVGAHATAAEWTQRRADYVALLREEVEPAVDELGSLPTTLEGVHAEGVRTGWYGNVYGIDWGNLEAVWPTEVFAPEDPWATGSLKTWKRQTFEGIFGYPENGLENMLHSYTTSSIGITHVRRGDQREALQYLYGLLTHTSATHMAAEAMRAYERWGRHNAATDTMPHGEFAAKYMTMLHDMLAFEGQDHSLHLANVWSPLWAKPGERIEFAGDTDFGPLAYTIDVADGGAVMHLDPPTRDAPKDIVVSVPGNNAVTAVTVDGQRLHSFSGHRITLTRLTGPTTIEISWRQQTPAPRLSFARAVADYLANYRKMIKAPDVRIEDTAAAHPSVRVGDPLQVTANIVNTGGAGYLDDPQVQLYVDGKPTQTDDRSLAKGIGFTTPESVISFQRHDEGVVPVGFTPTLCEPGRHTLGIALGKRPPAQTVTVNVLPMVPTQPAPPAALSLAASPVFVGADPARAATATTTVTNKGCAALAGVDVTTQGPDGWTVEPTSPTTIDRVGPGDSATVTWKVSAPETPDDTIGEEATQLAATATYGWRTDQWDGKTTGSARDQIKMTVCLGTPPAADPSARAQWDLTLGCAADLSGHQHHGTVGSGTTFTDNGARFDGTDEGAITIPYGADYQPESIDDGHTWTLSLTGVVPEKVGGSYQAIANSRSTSAGYAAGWTVYLNPAGTFTFRLSQVNHPGSTYAIARSGVQVEPGKRYDITARWDGSQLSITVSGAGTGSGSAIPNGGYLLLSGAPMTLGKGRNAATDDYFFTGTIASAKIAVE